MQPGSNNLQWISDFVAARGRAPRILHIGNIANNAYNNARLLNEAGLDCDVICYDYYHVMGCPEWEDGDISDNYGDQFKPDWVAAKVSNFERPRWFAQGPVITCIGYLIAKRTGQNRTADALWKDLSALNGSTLNRGLAAWKPQSKHWADRWLRALRFVLSRNGISSRIAAACDHGRVAAISRNEEVRIFGAWCLLTIALSMRIAVLPFRGVVEYLRKKIEPPVPTEGAYSFDSRVAELIERFVEAFPDRTDVLTKSDCEMYRNIAPHWRELFKQYDIVQAYSTDPILPMLADKRPYVGFEHGTLRSHTLNDEQVSRLTSLAYHLADHVFITNGDCIDYAHKIGVTRFSAMLHPVDERRIEANAGDYERLHNELGVRHIFLCTLRHDWAIKGTDHYIRALPGLTNLLGRDFRVIMTLWGAELERSIALAKSLHVSDLIIWGPPLPRRKLIQTLKSVDVLFDQLALPHFGATAPEGIASGVPVIMSYDPLSTAWLVSEPAPILSAKDPAEIVMQVARALDPGWLRDYRRSAAKWFAEQHSTSHVVQKHAEVYGRLISNT